MRWEQRDGVPCWLENHCCEPLSKSLSSPALHFHTSLCPVGVGRGFAAPQLVTYLDDLRSKEVLGLHLGSLIQEDREEAFMCTMCERQREVYELVFIGMCMYIGRRMGRHVCLHREARG